MGPRSQEVGEEVLYLTLHCRIKIGSDENHFNASLIVRDKVTRWCPQITLEEASRSGIKLRPFCLPALWPSTLVTHVNLSPTCH